MERDAVDGGAVRLKGMSGWRARKPRGWILVSARERGGCCAVEFRLEI